jgi:hypothetical protein
MTADFNGGFFYNPAARHEPSTYDVVYTVANPAGNEVLKIDPLTGVITANSVGRATVRMSSLAGNRVVTSTINVKDAPTAIDLNPTSIIVAKGGNKTFRASPVISVIDDVSKNLQQIIANTHMVTTFTLDPYHNTHLHRYFTLNARTGNVAVNRAADLGDSVRLNARVEHPQRIAATERAFYGTIWPGAAYEEDRTVNKSTRVQTIIETIKANAGEVDRLRRFYDWGIEESAEITAGIPEVPVAVLFDPVVNEDNLGFPQTGESITSKYVNFPGKTGNERPSSIDVINVNGGKFYQLTWEVVDRDNNLIRNQDLAWTTTDRTGANIVVYPDGEFYVRSTAKGRWTINVTSKFNPAIRQSILVDCG